MTHTCINILVWATVLLLLGGAADAHPAHVSIAEVEYNSKSNCLEVSLRVHPTDLETSLRSLARRRLDLDTDPEVDRWIKAYVAETFRVWQTDRKQRPFQLKWVGKEISVKSAWLYFEIPLGVKPGVVKRDVKTDNDRDAPDFAGRLKISNQVFFERLEDQVNTINLRRAGKVATLRCTRQRPRHDLVLGPAANH